MTSNVLYRPTGMPEAASVGLNQAGEFVLYIRAEEVAVTPKTFTLKADGYPEVTVTIVVAAPVSD